MDSIMQQVAKALNRRGTGVAFVRNPEGCPSIDEMYALNTLQPGQTYVMGLHFAGQATFQVYYAADQRGRE